MKTAYQHTKKGQSCFLRAGLLMLLVLFCSVSGWAAKQESIKKKEINKSFNVRSVSEGARRISPVWGGETGTSCGASVAKAGYGSASINNPPVKNARRKAGTGPCVPEAALRKGENYLGKRFSVHKRPWFVRAL